MTLLRLLPALILPLLPATLAAAPSSLDPATVAVIYNADLPESRDLANYYAERRNIPAGNLIGLSLPTTDLLSRADFDARLRDPLRKAFDERGWWNRIPSAGGNRIPTNQKIRVLLTLRGVPFGISRSPAGDPEAPAQGPHQLQDEAAVDSELALLGFDGLEIKGALNNPLFDSKTPAAEADLQGVLLTGRLDGPSFELCKRLIDDAITTEKEGLWGMCYLDLARKTGGYQVGEDWIESIARHNHSLGIPTVVDRNHDTYVTNYPMRDASLYFGWYIPTRNGPLLNPGFRFKRGAVAVHLHSFSAAKLRTTDQGWSGPLLDRGAAATVGNVFEPFLQMTHHFDILHDRLVNGFSLVEAGFMAIPVLSWQGVVLGDPLYRPFARFSDTDGDTDRDYKTVRAAWLDYPADAETRTTKLRAAAARTNSGILYEAAGLSLLMQNNFEQANAFFDSAGQNYREAPDRLRQDLHRIDLARQAGRKQEAINRLRAIQPGYAALPEGLSVTALLNILDPPAPPPAALQLAAPEPNPPVSE